ncbi:hypothetical protein SAMN05216474_2947 [Lishizhenia tianjinensis]|uniref:Transposase zinc-ribbon domain-containing protein n=1 Tax=Lishizhenia tianjinensis TaxID=477690 RepID=A0A1I7BNS8_9FLAO|nr:hypothetical protein [Lishizhenia tianjinensis]SFT88826.1 hypothetical protein SAMN05216474_2947 [Lishizhenia tianjinensis]
MNINQFIRLYGSEKKCISFIKTHREACGISCPKCNSNVTNWKEKHLYWRCKCGKKISLKSGTLLESTKLKYAVWFKAIFLMTHVKKSYSTLELARLLGIKRYRTVWYLCMKIRTAMGQELLAREYFQFLYILSKENKSEYNINSLRHNSISAILKKAEKGRDEINLIAPQILHERVHAREVQLARKKYRCLKILGAHEKIELKPAYTPTKPGIQLWMKKLLRNSNKLLNGIHHGVSFLHLQKYMFEFSFNYNYRYKDKFNPIIQQLLT